MSKRPLLKTLVTLVHPVRMFDGMKCYSAWTLVWPQVRLC